MPLLFERLRAYAVFGANTDVGKTVLTTILCRASASAGQNVFYLKPVSTGSLRDADDSHLVHFGGPSSRLIDTRCLFRYDEPVSPHLAAHMANYGKGESSTPSDSEVVSEIASHIHGCANSSSSSAFAYIETAGGVHSPTLSGSSQADAYRPLRLPVILVGDSRLGGISSTISAYESLVLRGYDVNAVLLFKESYYRNWQYLEKWFAKYDIRVGTFPGVPSRLDDPTQDQEAMEAYYASTCESAESEEASSIITHLDTLHSRRIAHLASMQSRTLDSVWWPFTQHKAVSPEDVMVIDSAFGDLFTAYKPARQPLGDASQPAELPVTTAESLAQTVFDGSASWWTQSFGHANAELALAAAYAAGRYGHVMFPVATHEPALRLAERLIAGPGNGWASRAFFSDDGSTGMEVALKMAIKASSLRYGSSRGGSKKSWGVLGLKGSYHGDTVGAMDACEGSVYNATVEWYQGRGYWFDPPTVNLCNGPRVEGDRSLLAQSGGSLYKRQTQAGLSKWSQTFGSLSELYDVNARLQSPLADVYRCHIRVTIEQLIRSGHTFGAVVIEPILMGAGGMIFVDPLFQRILIDVVRSSEAILSGNADGHSNTVPPAHTGPHWDGLPVIFDEVFVGLNRLGIQSSAVLGTHPDIGVYAKVLTGGLVPMSVTLASNAIFRAFWSDRKVDALLHGHSYTAHPVGCAVANKTLDMIEEVEQSDTWSIAQQLWALQRTDSAYNSLSGSPASTIWSLWHPSFLQEVSSMAVVERTMAMGTVFVMELGESTGYSSVLGKAFLDRLYETQKESRLHDTLSPSDGFQALHARVLGNVLYFMTSLNTTRELLQSVENVILATLRWTEELQSSSVEL